MKLYTFVQPINDKSAFVGWFTNFEKCGVIRVDCDSISDLKAQSELVAIKYILFVKKISSNNIWGGNGIKLGVSSGVIKKLLNGKSNKTELYKYFGFISTNLVGVEIEVMKKLPNIPEPLKISNLGDFTQSPIDIISSEIEIETNLVNNKFGKIRFTKHALDKYKERNIFGEAKNPFRSIANQLLHPDLVKFETPNTLTKKIKYLKENTEYWGHPSSTLRFVMLREPEPDTYTLVTLYLSSNITAVKKNN